MARFCQKSPSIPLLSKSGSMECGKDVASFAQHEEIFGGRYMHDILEHFFLSAACHLIDCFPLSCIFVFRVSEKTMCQNYGFQVEVLSEDSENKNENESYTDFQLGLLFGEPDQNQNSFQIN